MISLVPVALLAATLAQATPAIAPSQTPQPPGTVLIANSGSTNTAAYELTIAPDGETTIDANGAVSHATLAPPQARWLFLKLKAAPPLDTLPTTRCMKSTSFGTSTTMRWNGATSPDLSCSDDATVRELGRIAGVVVAKLGVRTLRSPRRQEL